MKILKKISVVHLLLVLLILCTYSQARAGSIAYIHGATNGQDSVYDYLSGHFTSMTLINANAPLPTLSQLLSYNAILVSTNRYWDGGVVRSSELGNLLADYVDAGGSLVVAAFSWQGEANGITGRFISGNYSPFTSGNGSKNADVHISHVFDRTNAIFTGVNDILGYYRDNVSPTGGSNVLAYWEDGVPLIAISNKNVIGINLFPETYYGFIGGDYEQLFVNLLKYAGVGSTSDIIPPEIVTNLNVTPYEERLVFTWNSSLNKGRDLAGYRVYFNNERGITLLPSENTFEKTGLDPATLYHFRVTAFDAANNESGNSYIKAATLAENPENIVATPHTGYVDLTWDASTPVNIIKNYKIYYKESNFDTVKFLDSKMTVNGTSCRVNGLINNVTYYFAVTAVNISNGENTTVIPVTAKPMPDTIGPTIGDVTLDGQVVSGSATINSYGLFSLSPLDESGVSRVEFYINDELKGKVYSTSGGKFVFGISAYDVEDGDYQISIKAYDSVGNVSTAGPFQLSVDLSKPVAPVIKSPATGFITNRNNVSIKGQAAKNTLVSLFNDDNEILNSIQVSDAGEFSADMPIHEGENTIHAIASNRAGSSPVSQDVVVILDNSRPTLPYGLSAKPNLNGEIYLTWQMADESNVAGYNLYRSDESFEDLDDAEKVNSRLITKKNYTDLPFDDGKWFYRITSVNKAGSESDMSPIVSATSDSIRPTAVSVTYDPKGNFDPQSGVMAPGLVNITVKTSEVLAATPFFSITPNGGKPCSITLERVSELEYKGVYEITETTPSGTAYAVFSGRDLTGNRGTDILAGSTISIDTDGPAVRKITLTPQSPVKNDSQNPVEITAVFGLNEKIKNDAPIVFSYIIAGDTENPHTIDNVTEITTEEGDAQTFRAVFTLPGTSGEAAAESLTFAFSCQDKLGNAGNTFQSENNFQVYQGDLPPLGIPLNFKGQSIPGGDIKLTWNAVASASGYQLYRKTPVEDTLTPFGTPLPASSLTFMDTPEVEGEYVYTIATIRSWNGQQSLSGQSAPVVVSSDATAPSPPTGLVLDLIPKGIRAVWTAPANQEELTYAFYRARSEADISAGNMTLIQKGFKQTSWIDFNPSVTDHFYVVTTIDRTGNESAPSATGYFNAKLLPVSTVTVNITENAPPRLAWAHPGGDIAGFDLYTGNGESREKVGEGLITGHEYTDSGYTGTDLRVYTLQAVDAQGAKSLEREISVPKITATHVKGTKIFRNQINTLKYTVENFSSAQVKNVRLKIKIHECEFMSDSFTLEPKAPRTVDIIVPGHTFFNDYELVNTSVVISPDQSETVTITRQSELSVRSGMMIVDILNEEFVRGTEGQVRFTLENPGDGTVEFITARRNGSDPSDEITFTITDFEGNVHSTKSFKQVFGSRLITLSNGTTVARIPAKSTFMSDPIGIEIPYTVPEYIQIGLGIKNFYSNSGNENQVKMSGISTKRDVLLTETSYYGEIVSISPAKSSGKEDIVITGKGVLRASGDPVPDMPLKLYVSLKGFDRSYDILTDKNGDFTYTFKPAENEAGIYYVRVLHPKRIDKPIHGQFEINKLFAPSVLTYSYPKNYKQTIAIPVELSEGFSATNLRLVRFAPDSGSMEIPDGIHMDEAAPVTLASGEKGTLNLKVWADNTAPDTLTLNYHLVSDESAGASLKDIKITITFSEAKPYLTLSNTFIETGVVLNDQVSETLTLKNNGLMDMAGVRVSLTDLNGNKTPNWAALNVSGDIGAIAIGETASVGIQCAPDTTVAEGQYSFILKISGDNIPSAYVPVYVSVVENGTGSVSLKLNDIYTGTLDASNQVIQGVSNAKVVLVKENLPSDRHEVTSDAGGNVDITDLSPGYYHCRITVSKHTEYTDRLKVVPDVTTTKNIYLENQLVTVDWNVNEVTIQDSYNLELNTTYETDVPAAVVVPTSSTLKLPSMEPGLSYATELEYKNHGLVAAENVRIVAPESDFYRYEILSVVPSTIEPHETIKVPVRVTCLKSSDGDGAGAAAPDTSCYTLFYTYTCRKGTINEWTYTANRNVCPVPPRPNGAHVTTSGTLLINGRVITRDVDIFIEREPYIVDVWDGQFDNVKIEARVALQKIVNELAPNKIKSITFRKGRYDWDWKTMLYYFDVVFEYNCGAVPSTKWDETISKIKSRFLSLGPYKNRSTLKISYSACSEYIQKSADYNKNFIIEILKSNPAVYNIIKDVSVKCINSFVKNDGVVTFNLDVKLLNNCKFDTTDAKKYILAEYKNRKTFNPYYTDSLTIENLNQCPVPTGLSAYERELKVFSATQAAAKVELTNIINDMPFAKQMITGVTFLEGNELSVRWSPTNQKYVYSFKTSIKLNCGVAPSEIQFRKMIESVKSKFYEKYPGSYLWIESYTACSEQIQTIAEYNKNIIQNIIQADPALNGMVDQVTVFCNNSYVNGNGSISFGLTADLILRSGASFKLAGNKLDYIRSEYNKQKSSNLYYTDKLTLIIDSTAGTSDLAYEPYYEEVLINEPSLDVFTEPYFWKFDFDKVNVKPNSLNFCRLTNVCKSDDVCCVAETCYPKGKEYGDFPGGSYIHPIKGFYTEHFNDLSVKIPGGFASANRRYIDGDWVFPVLESDLKFVKTFISKEGALYTPTSETNCTTYKFGPNRKITKNTDNSYRWSNTAGDWIDYSSTGKILSSGNKKIELIRYERDGSGRISTIKDRNGRVVLTYKYYGSTSKIEYVEDCAAPTKRRVTYFYENNNTGILSRVKDVMGNETVYGYGSYNIAGKSTQMLTSVTALGKTRTIAYRNSTLPTKLSASTTIDKEHGLSGGVISKGMLYVKSTTDLFGNTTLYDFGYDYNGAVTPNINNHYRLAYDSIRIKSMGYDLPSVFNDTNFAELFKEIVKKYPNIEDPNYYGYYIFAVESPTGKVVESWYDGSFNKIWENVNGIPTESFENDEFYTVRTDAMGVTTTTKYDEWKNPKSIRVEHGESISTQSFDYVIKNGIVLIDIMTNPNGVKTKYIYDDNGYLTDRYDAYKTSVERRTRYEYDEHWNVKSESVQGKSETTSSVVSYTYFDEDGSIKTITDPENNTVSFSNYNVMGQARTITDADGKIWKTEYDAYGRQTSATDPLLFSGSVQYLDLQNAVTSTDAEGKTSSTFSYPKYSAVYELLTETRDNDSNSTFHYYALKENYEKIVDQEKNHVLTKYFNKEGLVEREVQVKDGKLYDTGNLLVDPIGHMSEIQIATYRFMGRISDEQYMQHLAAKDQYEQLQIKYDNVTRYEYYPGTSLIKTIHYPTYKTKLHYDGLNRMCRKIDVFEEKDESGETFENEYITDYFYTPTGKIRKTIAPQNQIKTFKYDELDRLVCENDNGKITRYTYDSRNNQLTLIDAEYNTTRFEYYKNNLLKSKTMPNGQKEYYYYNANGQIKYLVDPKKQVVKKQYFGNGELEKESYFEAIPALSPSVLADVESKVAGKTPVKVVSYTYDKMGNPKTYTDGTTSGVYTYDNLYRLHDETINYGAFSLSNTYDYYKNGLPKSLTGPDNIKYDYSYNKLQLTDVAIPGQGTVTFSDYKWNSAQKILLPGGTEFTYSYDDLMRLTGISSKAAGKAVMNYTYAYDSLSRITDKKTEHGNYAYGYDDHNRLTSATSPVFGNESFTYDDVGNRKTSGETAGTHQYSNNNELLRIDALSGAILPQQYHYNTNGSLLNTTSQSPTLTDKSFTYDVTDRLTKVENAAKTQTIADYSYDPFGRRLWKEVNGVRTYFFYSSQGLSGEYNASGQVIKTYGYLPGSAWTTDPLFMKVGATYYYYHNDHLGTPVKMTSANGAVVWSANYKAFGEAVVDAASTVENNLRFPGQYYDKETGLHYNWNRYYDPKMGRYIGPDPLGFGGGDVNLYAYCGNNPMMGRDPMGLVDINYLQEERDGGFLWGSMNNYVSPDNTFSVGIHGAYSDGTPMNMVAYYDKQEMKILMSAEDLAKVITDHPRFYGQDIYLLACGSGFYGEYSFAQRLANILQVNVWAPRNMIGPSNLIDNATCGPKYWDDETGDKNPFSYFVYDNDMDHGSYEFDSYDDIDLGLIIQGEYDTTYVTTNSQIDISWDDLGMPYNDLFLGDMVLAFETGTVAKIRRR